VHFPASLGRKQRLLAGVLGIGLGFGLPFLLSVAMVAASGELSLLILPLPFLGALWVIQGLAPSGYTLEQEGVRIERRWRRRLIPYATILGCDRRRRPIGGLLAAGINSLFGSHGPRWNPRSGWHYLAITNTDDLVFLEIRGGWAARNVASRGLAGLGRVRPYAKAPGTKLDPEYVRSIHRDFRGTWDFDLRWKPEYGFPVYAGWIAAVRRGQRRVASGLAIDVPVLVMASTRGHRPRGWDERLRTSDAVLDPDAIVRVAPRLGPDVTIVRIDGGLHDLMLSGETARAQVVAALDRWMRACLPP